MTIEIKDRVLETPDYFINPDDVYYALSEECGEELEFFYPVIDQAAKIMANALFYDRPDRLAFNKLEEIGKDWYKLTLEECSNARYDSWGIVSFVFNMNDPDEAWVSSSEYAE